MQLSIGDVVRDRADRTLGTVAGIANKADGNEVVLQLSGGGLRRVMPYDLELVARYSKPMTTGRSIATLFAIVAAAIAAFLGAQSAQGLGGNWLLTLMVSFGSSSTVLTAFQLLLRATGPRRIRL